MRYKTEHRKKKILGAVIGAAASIGGGLLANKGNRESAQTAGEFNQASAQQQMKFQRKMSDTAVYRRMRDLKRSGINPILAGQYDASSPAGAMATMPMAPQSDFITPGINTGMALSTTGAGLEKTAAEIEKISADTGVSRAQVHKISADIDSIAQGIEQSKTQADLNETTNHLKDVLIQQGELDVQKLEVSLRLLQMEQEVYENNPNLKKLEVGARAGGGPLGLQGAIGTGTSELLTILEEVYNNAEKTGMEIIQIIERKMQELSR